MLGSKSSNNQLWLMLIHRTELLIYPKHKPTFQTKQTKSSQVSSSNVELMFMCVCVFVCLDWTVFIIIIQCSLIYKTYSEQRAAYTRMSLYVRCAIFKASILYASQSVAPRSQTLKMYGTKLKSETDKRWTHDDFGLCVVQ